MRFQGSFDLPRGKTLCIVFIAQIEWVAKIGFLIGNDLETSEVLYSALLNPKNADFKCKGTDWAIPAVNIQDAPRFEWRGIMLDVSRHFYTIDEVKELLDVMAGVDGGMLSIQVIGGINAGVV
jgi:hypothetical protein